MLKRFVLFAMAAMLFFAVQAGSANANLIQNGNFGTGDFTGWSLGGNYANPLAWVTVNNDGLSYTPPAPSATYAQIGTAGAPITLSQTLSDAAGQSITVGFFAMNGLPASTPNNEFKVLWDGTPMIDITSGMSSAWTPYSFTVTATGSDTLTYSFLQDAATINLTNVSASTVPIPSALPLFGSGLVGLVAVRKRFHK